MNWDLLKKAMRHSAIGTGFIACSFLIGVLSFQAAMLHFGLGLLTFLVLFFFFITAVYYGVDYACGKRA